MQQIVWAVKEKDERKCCPCSFRSYATAQNQEGGEGGSEAAGRGTSESSGHEKEHVSIDDRGKTSGTSAGSSIYEFFSGAAATVAEPFFQAKTKAGEFWRSRNENYRLFTWLDWELTALSTMTSQALHGQGRPADRCAALPLGGAGNPFPVAVSTLLVTWLTARAAGGTGAAGQGR